MSEKERERERERERARERKKERKERKKERRGGGWMETRNCVQNCAHILFFFNMLQLAIGFVALGTLLAWPFVAALG